MPCGLPRPSAAARRRRHVDIAEFRSLSSWSMQAARLDRQELILCAVRREKAAFAVYTRAAATAAAPLARELQRLARTELRHLVRLLHRCARECPAALAAVDIAL